MNTEFITKKSARCVITVGTLLLLLGGASCQRELYIPDMEETGGRIIFGAEGIDIDVETKASEVTSLSSFYVSAVTGSAGSEVQVWNSAQFSQVPGSSPAVYAGDKYWPDGSDPSYKFYASNVPLTFAAGGTAVSATNATDVVVAYRTSNTYKSKNTLTFEHVFARIGTVTVAAVPGYTLSGINIRVTPKTGGTYNIRTGAGQTDNTGWSGVTTGSATTIASATGANANSLWLVPGDYDVVASWTSRDLSGTTVTHTNKVSRVSLKKGAVNNFNIALGGDIMLGIDISEFVDNECVQNLEPLTFEALGNGSILWKTISASWVKTIEYSKDNGATWTAIESTTAGAAIPVSTGEKVLVRGNNAAYSDGGYYCSFSGTTNYYVYGNMTDLLANGYKSRLDAYCFYFLFENNAFLRTHNSKQLLLPSIILAGNCYSYMFRGCTGLTTAPELPASKLADNCYSYMFFGCIGLTTAPELPATTLAGSCYFNMFYGCTGLTTAPELPATTLEGSCYVGMFQNCTGLTTAPELPATTLAGSCYSNMFYGCTGLTTAPELPATTLTNNCYTSMFQNCSRLNYIKAFFTTTPSLSYTYNWVSDVASTGTFVKADNATWDVTGVNGVPTGWTVIRESELPGEFSVSATKKVKFSRGNLQAVIGTGISDYRATASSYNFAEHQYDFVGATAGNTSFAVGTTVDLFGWVGESADYDSYGLCTNTASNNAYYGTSASDALKTDWGSIPGIDIWIGSGWRTLTTTEWNYLFTQRANASSLYGQCQITTASGTVTGMLILPDNWTKPSNCTVTPGSGAFDRVTYSATAASGASNAWVDMEAAGAVFLPAAGSRGGVGVGTVGGYGYYWSSSVLNEYNACYVYFNSGYLDPQGGNYRYDGFSVRLVR